MMSLFTLRKKSEDASASSKYYCAKGSTAPCSKRMRGIREALIKPPSAADD